MAPDRESDAWGFSIGDFPLGIFPLEDALEFSLADSLMWILSFGFSLVDFPMRIVSWDSLLGFFFVIFLCISSF